MNRTLVTMALWSVMALPCQAKTVLEIGTTPHVSLHVEGERASFGVGLSVFYRDDQVPTSEGYEEIHMWLFTPSAGARLFLNREGSARSFLEARASRGIASASGVGFIAETLEEFYDNWTASFGAGVLATIHDRVRVGGAVDARAEFLTEPAVEDSFQIGSSFRVFLDYVL